MSSSGDLVLNSDEHDLEVHSAYEDALDESDTELKLLCLAAAKRLRKQRYLSQFQDAANNPLLMQINQQMQMLSRQLYDIESTNALQLRIIAKLLSKLIKAQQWPRNILARFFRFLQVLFIVLMGPFIVKAIRRLFCKSQQGMAVNPFRYW
ncbi:unnamed protein product [Angiostrongylus costaricensis]|uniref:Uncharacterized protein n=1 Tax=Angiostrongylus costaricensis TaxID=334426 RepID=A0A158PHR4_ANGCS|nr:unnamed protein product [Angiostrongylus costaricensis]